MRIPRWWRRRRTLGVSPEAQFAVKQAKEDLAFTRAQTPIFRAMADGRGPDEPKVTPTERGSRNGG